MEKLETVVELDNKEILDIIFTEEIMDFGNVMPATVLRSDAGRRVYMSIFNSTDFTWMPGVTRIAVWWEAGGWLLKARGSGRVKALISQPVPPATSLEYSGMLLPKLLPDHRPDCLVVASLSSGEYTELARLDVIR